MSALVDVSLKSIFHAWDFHLNLNVPCCVLSVAAAALRQVAFGGGQCGHLLVSLCDAGLRVWDLQTRTLAARIDVRVTLLVADPLSEYMAAFSASNKGEVLGRGSARSAGARQQRVVWLPQQRRIMVATQAIRP